MPATLLHCFAAGALLTASAVAAAPSPSTNGPSAAATEVAPGVYLVPGRMVAGVQPDGNSVVFRAPDGTVIVDSGRHAEHTEAVLALAERLRLPPRAVVNTHWHLDHLGGNLLIRDRHPPVRVYASDAFAGARGGFLANYRRQLAEMIASPKPSTAEKEAFRREMALIDAGDRLAPDEVLAAGGRRELAGLPLELHVERQAVTAADVWVLDPATRVLVAGDLVTLPVPLFDTACPAGWQTALSHLAAADWQLLVPGHGPPLRREDFAAYRRAFDGLLACAASARPKAECVDGWFRDAGPLAAESDSGVGRPYLDYYVDTALRAGAAEQAKRCGGSSRPSTPA